MLKFAIPDSKKLVVVDCGNKIHLTDFERPMAPAPSSFVSKLRKHLKSRRLSGIKQVDNDRILVFQFSDGEYYLVFEFFSAGNVLLLDKDLKILALQRLVKDLGPDHATYATAETYLSFDSLLFGSSVPVPVQKPSGFTELQVLKWVEAQRVKLNESSEKSKKVFSVHKLLFVNASFLSNDLILKTLLDCNIDHSKSCLELDSNSELLTQVVAALNQTEYAYYEILELTKKNAILGYIVEKKNPLFKPSDEDSLEYIYDEFHPFKPFKKSGDFRFLAVEGYNQTIDQFFSTIESTKHSLRIEQQKQHAQKRLDNAKNERDRQIENLVSQQEMNERRGEAILYHADLVEACAEYVNDMIIKQMDWTDIENIIKFDVEKNHREALLIKLPLHLEKNIIKLSLIDHSKVDEATLFQNNSGSDANSESESESESEDDSDDSESDYDSDDSFVKPPVHASKKKKTKEIPTINVDINLSQSAFANASLYFGQKKEASSKQAKVEKNSDMAMKNAEKRVERDLAKKLKSEVDALKTFRHKYWFEKFFWFVSSEGYLCLAGRDEIQVDMIYYRHFGDDCYFVTSDVEGALKVFILNPYPQEDVSPTTLFQAGVFALLTSVAWNAKTSTSAWWLKGKDVTKKEFDGSLLGPGRLNFKAAKNYMPPAQLVMGLGFYWLGDEHTAKRYTDIRFLRQEEHGLKVKVSHKKADLEGIDILKLSLKEKDNKSANHSFKENDITEDSIKLILPDLSSSGQSDYKDVFPECSIDSKETDAGKSTTNPVKAVRGKKGKLKKQKAKYADQDDEERRLRIEALGTLKQIEIQEKQKTEEKMREADALQNKYNQRRHAEQRDRKAEERELQKYFEADEDAFDETYLAMLDSFIAKPSKADTIATAVTVFAPWASLAKFKYKVKVQPGLGKKGKSLSEAYNYFSKRKVDTSRMDADEDWPEEHDIISNLASADAIGTLTVSKLKMVLPALAANGNNGKKGAKKEKK